MTQEQPDGRTFHGLGIAPRILEVIAKVGFTVPTPIQHKAIPVAIGGADFIGIAQTGTGKTLAFAIPIIQKILAEHGQGLVVLPTRELAVQVNEVFEQMGRPLGVRTAILIGGEPIYRQNRMIQSHPNVIIGTPGRIIDHLTQKTLNLSGVNILVLDEADRMLDMGFAPQLKRILQMVPKDRQTMLFSATMPEEIVRIAKDFMKIPTRIEIAPAGRTADKVTQEVFFVHRDTKIQLLRKLLEDYRGSMLVFTRTKHGARKVTSQVRAMGYSAAEIHSNRSLPQRREALAGFKNGVYRVLVATDIAARGIDVANIELVVNFDLPDAAEDYVHRIGRTARAGREGRAISFALPDQMGDIRQIERLIRIALPVSKLPAGLPAAPAPAPFAPREANRYPRSPRPFSSRPSYPTRKPFEGSASRFGHRPRPDSGYSSPAPLPRGSRPLSSFGPNADIASPRPFRPFGPPRRSPFGINRPSGGPGGGSHPPRRDFHPRGPRPGFRGAPR